MSLTLLQLRAFVAVSRHGSFSAAATALHRTQPGVTVQVRQLEEALGVRLFDRTTRAVRLTSVGQEMAPVISALLQEIDEVVERSQDLRAKRMGVVKIGCLPSVAASFLPRAIGEFRKAFPGISFVLKDDFGDRVVARVRAGEVEFGITDVSLDAADLTAVSLFEERMCVFYIEGHAIGRAKRLDVDELAKHELILTAPGSNARRIVDAAFAAAGRVALPTCEVNYMSSAVGLVEAGLGVALLPYGALDLNSHATLKSRAVNAEGFGRPIAVISMKDKTLSPAAHAFMQMVLSKAGRRPPRSRRGGQRPN
jgi:DNA-binding transcriptional LysR family regulator